jgi:uncharacterized protein
VLKVQVQLEQVRQKPFSWNEIQHIPVERLKRSEVVDLADVAWKGHIVHAGSGFHLKASSAYEQTVECVRCLNPMVQAIESETELMIFVEKAEAAPGEYELAASDLGVLYLDSDILDLEPLLMEQLQLNVPMGAVCGEECLGLCPKCGINRNNKTCDCDSATTDLRWAGLSELRDRLE